jgi:predicted component of type VI protein secretion system
MKVRIELRDDLYRRAKRMAVRRGCSLATLIEEGLRRVLETRRPRSRGAKLATLMKRARGMIDSGIPDLASNPKHLAGFGRKNH